MNTNVPFDVMREDYSVYEIENGQILKVKQSITEIINTNDPDPAKQSKISSKTISVCTTIKKIDTSDLEESTPDKTVISDQTHELKFKMIKEPVNVFETKISILLLNTHIYKIFATTKKDHNGDPIIRFSAVHDLAITKKPLFDDEQLRKNDPLEKKSD